MNIVTIKSFPSTWIKRIAFETKKIVLIKINVYVFFVQERMRRAVLAFTYSRQFNHREIQ